MNKILKDFKKDFKFIQDYYQKLLIKTRQDEIIGSTNEWIVDNYYIISEQEKFIKENFDVKALKKIKNKRKIKLFNIMFDILNKNDFKEDFNYIAKELNTYQKTNKDYFSYNEINCLYSIVRLVLVRNVALLSSSLEEKLRIKENIEVLFEKINKKIDKNKEFKIEKCLKLNKNKYSNFFYIEQLNHKLKGLGSLSEKFFVRLNEILQEKNLVLKDIIRTSQNEHAQQNVLMMHSINSLKAVSKYKIEDWYKNISFAEIELLKEKEEIYSKMHENNKADYRRVLVKKAKNSSKSEYDYAKEVVNKADSNKMHIGWFLFEKKDYNKRAFFYISVIIVLSILLSFITSIYLGISMFFLSLIPLSNLVIEIFNKLLGFKYKRNTLFKLKFEEGLPEDLSTMVVVPTLVKNKDKVIKMFEKLEVSYLSNETDNIYFTLLADCSESDLKDTSFDQEIVNAGLKKVRELNKKYGKKLFYFVYRNRFYNEGEDSYLGYERKRGALNHFNKLILNKLSEEEKNKYFRCHTFDDFKTTIKYVITLDTDTKLVLNTALKLIGAMAHPMNIPVLSKDRKKVIAGHAIMQPRVSIDVEVTNQSIYSQLFAGLGGLDIYTTASFDLYQDVFSEGSFVGKGIYDVAIFEEVLENAFPENLILSHDLIEGNYLRCGFINDVELFDDYPSSYLSDAARHHRWNRGDWQIISWLKNKVNNFKNEKIDNPLTLLEKWKIFDNLRRSLVSFFLLLILLYGYFFSGHDLGYYIIFDFIIIAVPIMFYLISKVVYRSKYDRSLRYYLSLIKGVVAVINKSFIVLALLPYESYLYLDSIIKALYRMFISKKNLLNWITAEEMEKTLKNNFITYLKAFKMNYVIPIFMLLNAFITGYNDMHSVIIISIIWLFAPILMYVISKPLPSREKTLNKNEKAEIKDIAFKTWRYFDDLLTEERNYLIPDNYQYNREIKSDFKTSSTNMAYSLLSVISACELDFISDKKAIRLLNRIFTTIEKLEKWNGHLYNWYDIYTLDPLNPRFISSVDNGNFVAVLFTLKGFLAKHKENSLYKRVNHMIETMDFKKLYNRDIDVFSVGYQEGDNSLLPYHYNNFASEARLTSFIAIAKGDVPYKHWFCLDKTLTKYKKYKGVASWSGTAFEYFMPLIFMRTYEHTLLDESYYYAYYAQKEFIKEIDSKLPWGISESAYNELDDSQNYKYNAFGVPYLKFQDSAHYPIVISPYSSILAISVDDKEVYHNIKKLEKLKMIGEYGFYEAYDNEDKAIIKNHYAHHQGMILASLTNYLKEDIIHDYFEFDKRIPSIEMLAKEKVQIKTLIDLKLEKYKKHHYKKEILSSDVREYTKLNKIPEMAALSNGLYTVLLDDRGNGFSKYKNLQINRYRMVTEQNNGLFFYIKNLKTEKVFSNTYAPLNEKPENYKVVFSTDKVKYIRTDEGIITTTEVTVTKDHNASIRKLSFFNTNDEDVELEVTSFGEVIMCRNEEDVSHRAFNSIMIDSFYDEDNKSLVFTRKSMTKKNTIYYVTHKLFGGEEALEYETSRYKFLGRNESVNKPKVVYENESLSNTDGAALDPIMSMRKKVKVPAKEKVEMFSIVGFGKSKAQVDEIINSYNNKFSIDKAFSLATVFNNMRNSYANLTARQMHLYNLMLNTFYQKNQNLIDQKLLKNNNLGVSTLWKFNISGNLPIVLVEINDLEDVSFIKEVLKSFEYYKSKALYLDVVVINDSKKEKGKKEITEYIDKLLYRINNLNYFEHSSGEVFVISKDAISNEEYNLFKLVSKAYFNAASSKTLEQQLIALTKRNNEPLVTEKQRYFPSDELKLPPSVDFNNCYGGFINHGKEYMIVNQKTPTPWSNVIANDKFGFVITNNFGGYTYALNSREFKLTAWSNDPVSDTSSERIYINDMLLKLSYVKHGFGYSEFYITNKDYDITINVFVHKNDPAKIYDIKINDKTELKIPLKIKLSLLMVLGVSEEIDSRYILGTYDDKQNCIIFQNKYSRVFSDQKVYISSSNLIENSNLEGDYKDIEITFDPKKQESVSFVMSLEEKKIYNNVLAEKLKVEKNWQNKLERLTISTPDKSFNYMINGWSLYQTYASRLMAKTAFYQAGGAYGFRDQLQDILSILNTDSEYAKEIILNHAKHQFKEGDVLHWWHEKLKFGSRTKFSDDYLWLVYVVYEYVKVTGDLDILKEEIPFVIGESLGSNESEKGINFEYLSETEPLFNHLKLCINRALNRFGENGLPLMGSADWNDGMNNIGVLGKGESVFVGFFLYDILGKMTELSIKFDDLSLIDTIKNRRKELENNLNKNAWDGAWYLRAFFDNGEPLGSRNNDECKIDLLVQSWSIISDMITKQRRKQIIKEVDLRLVDLDNNIIKLLAPPFKDSSNNPGYIMNYIKGIRENGGQYTHAALWYIWALLIAGEVSKANQYMKFTNPINKGSDFNKINKYKVEPYVIAGDVYSNVSHQGRGGWTWYTGSSSWFYKISLEEILGFKKQADKLSINPKVDKSWADFNIKYKYKDTNYDIEVILNEGFKTIVDGKEQDEVINLINDKKTHKVIVYREASND